MHRRIHKNGEVYTLTKHPPSRSSYLRLLLFPQSPGMSLDGGGISNGPEAQATASAMEEDYCLHGRERFQNQWARAGVFSPASLRVYGITGEPVLMRSIKQARMLSATFGTCFLGRFPRFRSSPSSGDSDAAAVTQKDNASNAAGPSRSGSSYDSLPFSSLLLGPCPPPNMTADPHMLHQAWRREVAGTWSALHMPSEWCQTMNGVATELSWSTRAQRKRIAEQLELAAFMCLRAVQVPLPFYAADVAWSGGDDDDSRDQEDNEGGATAGKRGGAQPMSDEEENQRNIRVACLAADVVLSFIQQCTRVKVWVRCDACNPAHRYQLQRLRQAVLYGYSTLKTDSGRVIYRINTPCSVTSTTTSLMSDASPPSSSSSPRSGVVHTEAASSLMALLYYSTWNPRMLLPSEWFGEEVVGFECPTAPALLACLAPHGVAPHEHPNYRPDAPGTASSTHHRPSATLAEEDVVEAQEQAHPNHGNPDEDNAPLRRTPPTYHDGESEGSRTGYSLFDWYDSVTELETSHEADSAVAAAKGGSKGSGSASDTSYEAAADCRRSHLLRSRYTYVMPEDLQPLVASRWAGTYPPFVSAITFIVELLRRRAMPVFDRTFFDQYPLLNYLHFKGVEEPTRDVFASFEGQLQLPLQPLSHHLSSGVYEVFERDARKYRQYREAVFHYVRDWYAAGAEQQHAHQNKMFFAKHGAMQRVPVPSPDERTLHLVLLGCGRGPLIDECLHAVSALGVRLRIFAIEKNPPAAAFTRMRWANDPEWMQLAYTFGHTLEVIVADGRTIATAAEDGSLTLPADFGLCDLIVSELLGSLGDNELSPECLEAFHAQLEDIQLSRGIAFNPHLMCIPQQYTAWVAPLMSATFDAAVTEAAVKGLTVPPPGCHDRHAALNHTLLVTNLSRAVTLAPPQPCWTFEHRFHGGSGNDYKGDRGAMKRREPVSLERAASLVFQVPPCGRCCGLAGYFSAVLYESATAPATIIATAPVERTEDMYSWFPCVFALEPAQQAELQDVGQAAAEESRMVAIRVQLDRRTGLAEQRVWYEWSVTYGDAAVERQSPRTGRDASAAPLVHNKNGWAASMLL
ncbi:putative arginine N-methyltransferase, type II [Leishmania infantum JPCM5]|uniref:Arginine_N-methyltransferase_-_type_II_-_putative n=2 Tax=Leishmania infantum TaxID=5671 RepID=A0A6L0XEJ1_LEIIN|nr:putative arginine N-methyltransferase, type II [Leishmania infantum JPCM5]CAC9486593.1 arginine_N-methyltransferase_-_type_II_-_putative [Leishmania infantum]CAM67854.1 putative arginine N-methyltransferase, type II [Leishmania infantum JPCM5]SUZ41632.1 arginine_N-methyltransferase_-_type_II_-_putative [Leishmania infantum]|eukprot:XP_001465433.1 putative arginine N-methyltransferase, type II [Leishmania infantum JPCM5]